MADKIVVLRSGRIEQVGAPLDLYRDPDNRFVAGFIGSPSMNFLKGVVTEGAVEVAALGTRVSPPVTLPSEGAEVVVGMRPEHLELSQGGSLTVDLTEALGGVSYAYLTASTGEKLIVEERGDIRSSEGDKVGLTIAPERIMVFDAATERRIR